MTMLIAGHETTAAVLTWCLYCLVQDQPLLDKVRAEIDEAGGGLIQYSALPSQLQLN